MSILSLGHAGALIGTHLPSCARIVRTRCVSGVSRVAKGLSIAHPFLSGRTACTGNTSFHSNILGSPQQSEARRTLSLSTLQANAQTSPVPVTMTSPVPHTALSVFVNDAQVFIQPRGPHTSRQLETLSVNLDTGKIQVLNTDAQSGNPLEVLAVLGVCKLHAGNALIVVTAAKQVASINGADVFQIAEAKVVASDAARSNKANQGLLRLLESAVDSDGAGRGLYFAHSYDLTQTTQRAANQAAADPTKWASQLPVQRASERFFWNKAIATPLLSAGAHAFVQPCILGFVSQLPNMNLKGAASGKPVSATLTLIARRAVARAGTRQWRRGADMTGAVANFAETEQLVTVDSPSDHPLVGTTASYVLVRGSIPLLWTQLPNIKYKPTTVIAPSELSGQAHDKHFSHLVDQYESVVAINLISHKGTEGKLETAFRAEATRLITSGTPLSERLRYVAFDFHHECGNKRYHRLSLLWDQIAIDFDEQNFCLVGGGPEASNGVPASRRQQSGVMRINCIDCLDRTNVVQGVFARKSVEAVLLSLGLLEKGSTLPEAYPDVEKQFKIIWADHGDMLSTQYAGTGAMKSGFTRTGVRTFGGVIDDGVKAVVRYYLNNYQDGVKQDAIDLFNGTYQCDTINAPPVRPQPSPLIPLFLSLLAMGLAAHNLMGLLTHLIVSHGSLPATVSSPGAPEGEAATGLLGTARRLASAVIYEAPEAAHLDMASIDMAKTAAAVTDAANAGSQGGDWLMVLAGSVAYYVFVPLAVGAGLLLLVLKNGNHLVNKPQLCPQLAVTVQKPPKVMKKKLA